MLHSIYQQIWTTQQWPQDWKRLVFIPTPKKGKAKECSNYHTVALILHARQVILKILQVRLQQDMHQELPDVQTGLEKAEEPEVILPTSVGSSKKQENFRKTSTSALLTMPKPLTVWITTNWKILKEIRTNCGKFLKRLQYQNTLPASWEICMQVKKQQLEPDMEQQTCSKLRKEYVKAVYCHPAYLACMQSKSCKMLGWMEHKLESRLTEEISIT